MPVEHHYHNDTAANDSSAMTVIVAIIAILLIVGLGIFALRAAGVPAGGGTTNQGELRLDLDTGNGATGGVGGTATPAQ